MELKALKCSILVKLYRASPIAKAQFKTGLSAEPGYVFNLSMRYEERVKREPLGKQQSELHRHQCQTKCDGELESDDSSGQLSGQGGHEKVLARNGLDKLFLRRFCLGQINFKSVCNWLFPQSAHSRAAPLLNVNLNLALENTIQVSSAPCQDSSTRQPESLSLFKTSEFSNSNPLNQGVVSWDRIIHAMIPINAPDAVGTRGISSPH